MLPIKETFPSHTFPIINSILIGLNLLTFVRLASLSPQEQASVATYALIPSRYVDTR